MSAVMDNAWERNNRLRLDECLDALRRVLEARKRSASAQNSLPGETPPPLPAEGPPALDTLGGLFDLSPFERAVLLLCAGVELDERIAAACAKAVGVRGSGAPNFGLALDTLPEPHWSALLPNAPLRRWRLVELDTAGTLLSAPLRIDERVLHYLAGVSAVDERLQAVLLPLDTETPSPASTDPAAARMQSAWPMDDAIDSWPCLLLEGADPDVVLGTASAGVQQMAIAAWRLRARDLPDDAGERAAMSVLAQREAALSHAAIVVDAWEPADAVTRAATAAFIDGLTTVPVIALAHPERVPPLQTMCLRVGVEPPSVDEQRSLWHEGLGRDASRFDAALDQTLQQFRLDTRGIHAACASLKGREPEAGDPQRLLWQACREQSRRGLDELGQCIEPLARWDDLVLPQTSLDRLHDIATHMRQRNRVYADWGFDRTGNRGLGISALFAGPSGTGKTMASEVLANELALDLFRIDLSQVVSKYIGETEKNLRRVFDAAEDAGAILLFDEADALFGKRSEVRDSHDRYANIEVSYLLQRMEAYRGIAILTTNMKDALDKAFLRRIRFVVSFPFPDADQRQRIWARVFPAQTPTHGLDPKRLARLSVAGGNIRNIAMNAAFIAAAEDRPVCTADLVRAARVEYAKMDRTISETELKGLQ